MSWIEGWAEAEASANARAMNLVTLEFHHPAFLDGSTPVAIRAVNDTQDHSLLLEASAPLNGGTSVTFKGIPFDLVWPEQSEARAPEIRIRMDNVGREVSEYLDAAVKISSPIRVFFRVYLFNFDTSAKTLAFDAQEFALRSVTVTEETIEGVASLGDLANKRAFSYVYNLLDYPGLNQSS